MTTEGYTRDTVLEAVRKGQSLEGQKLKGIDLSSADLRGALFKGAHFRYSDLRQSDLRGADLRQANLRHVNLTQADLREADLRGADLTHADIRGARLDAAMLKGAVFSNTRGLSTKVFFPQPVLESLVTEGTANLSGNEVIVPGRSERWKLVPAARVVGLEAGKDVKAIVSKLMTEDALKALGLEVYRDTALIAEGDTVYKLEPGMIGEPLHEIKVAEESPSELMLEPEADSGKPPAEPKKSDQDLINEFLLKRLTTS